MWVVRKTRENKKRRCLDGAWTGQEVGIRIMCALINSRVYWFRFIQG